MNNAFLEKDILDQFVTFGLPFIAALLYVFAALSLKRAGEKGVDIWLVAFFTNLMCGVLFAGLLFFEGTFRTELLWQPFVTALLFFAGQFLAFLSFHRGDVSIATPVLSLKIILVAFFSVLLLNSALGWMLWAASVLAALGVTLLSRSSGSKPGAKHEVGFTLLTAGLAALAFAIFDVLVMKWSPTWGLGMFLPVMMAFVALMSFFFVPLFKTPPRTLSPEAWRWLLGGGSLMSLQSLLFVGAIAYSGRGTVSNIVYATRGFWSVVAVWLIGHWFQSQEIKSGESKTLVLRLISALLIISAVVLALLSK